jgi:hypothetical protein
MIDMNTRLRAVRGIAKTETEAAQQVFQTLKDRGHPDAPPPTLSDGWGGIDNAMIEVYSLRLSQREQESGQRQYHSADGNTAARGMDGVPVETLVHRCLHYVCHFSAWCACCASRSAPGVVNSSAA